MFKNVYINCKKDYRHIICLLITLISLGAGFLFPNAIPRLAESIRDLVTSFFYYFFNIFDEANNPIPATVTNEQAWWFASEVWAPVNFFPTSTEEFFVFCKNFFSLVFNLDNFRAYLRLYYNFFVYWLKYTLLLLPPLALLIGVKLYNIKNTSCTERNKKSKQLINFEQLYFNKICKVIAWFKDMISFIRDYPIYLIMWILLWTLYFNIFSIIVSFIAYYLYFVSSWNLLSIYGQLLKLQIDLTPIIRFIPGIIWLILGIKIYVNWCNSIGDNKIYYSHRCNISFLRERGISTVLYGKMGTYKSQTEVAMAVTLQDMKFDDMYETMYKYDDYFPNFPWQHFRDEIDFLIQRRVIVDTISCRKWISRWGKRFDLYRDRYSYDEYQQLLQHYKGFTDLSFNYDYDRYPVVYNNGIKIITLYQALEEYACAYLVFTINSSLLFSNISIRSDSELCRTGNMPFRVSHLLDKDPYEKIRHSQYSHIIDMDMMRRGKQLVKDNPRARTILPGIYVYDELHAERKNMVELQEIKKSTDEANQKNDMHNISVSTSRHSNLIDYQSLVYFLGTIQRPDSLGAGTRQLGELAVITDKSDLRVELPFCSPFWIFEAIYSPLKSKWDSFYKELRINRCDQTLSIYLMKNFMSLLTNHHEKMIHLYGVRKLTIQIDDGLIEGKVDVDYWRQILRNEWSGLYVSDCMRGVFDPEVPNKMHVDDFKRYSGIVATPEELLSQNSYFQNDIRKMKGIK